MAYTLSPSGRKFIDGPHEWKVLSVFDDRTNGGASRFLLVGNDGLPEGRRWAVVHARRTDSADSISPHVIGVEFAKDSVGVRRIFMNCVARYIPEAMSADPLFFDDTL